MRRRTAAIGLCLLAMLLLQVPAFAVCGAGEVRAQAPADIFTSFEAPPTPAEVVDAIRSGIRIFEMDFEKPGAAEAIAAVRQAGGKVTAYHIGGGGGRAWGGVRTGEWVRRYDTPRDFQALTADVKQLVAEGADAIHFDNTHRFSGRRLEAIADAIVAGGAGFVAKNNPEKWNLAMKRRPDLRPVYAIVEDAMFDAEATQAAYDLAARGVPVYIVGFRQPIDPKGATVSDDYATAYRVANPWAKVLLMDDERQWDSRLGRFIR